MKDGKDTVESTLEGLRRAIGMQALNCTEEDYYVVNLGGNAELTFRPCFGMRGFLFISILKEKAEGYNAKKIIHSGSY